MRFVFLIPDLDTSVAMKTFQAVVDRSRLTPLQNLVRLKLMRTRIVFGGTLNLARHCWVARSCGVDAVLATMRGRDTYIGKGLPDLPFIRWADRRPEDICIVPDYVTELIDEVEGPAIAYLQVPIHTKANFNYQDERVTIWTDSDYMKQVCQSTYPGKNITIVPNVVDNAAFPFIPQARRETGLLFAFPRKGAEYIRETQKCYQSLGGKYWHIELVDGLSFCELAQQFRRPQAFLASAEVEGCALPPQESMAAGIVVVGKTARGANFCMQHRETAMTAETPEEAAKCLFELENAELRDKISRNAYDYISRYFPVKKPAHFWQETIGQYSLLKQCA